MKIAIDLRTILTGRLTGVEMVGLQITKQLVRSHPDDEFIFWYSGYNEVDERIEEFKRFIGFEDLSNARFVIWKVPNIILETLWMVLYWPKLDNLLGNPDIFWEPNARAIPVSSGCKKVTTFHDLSMYVYPEFISRKDNFYYKRAINLQRESETSAILAAVSYATKFDLIKFFKTSLNKIAVVHNGVDESYFEAPTAKTIKEVSEKRKLPKEYILAIGSIEPRKNLVNLIKALRILKDKWHIELPLLIAGGEGWFNHKQAVVDEVRKQRLGSQVKFLGKVTEEEKKVLLHSTSLLAYPSVYEGFGIPPLEGLAAGVPVVTSKISAIPEAVGDCALLVDPHDPADIAKGMAQMLKNPKLTKSLRLRGKLHAQKFNWKAAADKMYKIFQLAWRGDTTT